MSGTKGHCILSHGFESGPDATKVTALSAVAERFGWSHERPDYGDLDAKREISSVGDVPARLERLRGLARAAAARGPLVLAGSSLGARSRRGSRWSLRPMAMRRKRCSSWRRR